MPAGEEHMARKSRSSEIKFAELKRRAKMKSLSKDELAAYFMLDADKGVYAPPRKSPKSMHWRWARSRRPRRYRR
jgi:hypothetical protein